MSAIHLFLGLPLVLVPIGFHSNILLGVLLFDVHVASLQKSAHIPGSKSHYHICVLVT